MKFLFITLATLAIVAAGNDDDHNKAWRNFKAKFGKMFLSKNTENERKSNFIQNYQTVQSINEKFAKGKIFMNFPMQNFLKKFYFLKVK